MQTNRHLSSRYFHRWIERQQLPAPFQQRVLTSRAMLSSLTGMVVWRAARIRAFVLLGMLGLLAGCEQWLRTDGDPRREANYMQGESWMIQRDPQKAVASFERALEVNPQNYHAHERLADLHFNQNEFAPAYYHLQRYLNLSKDTNYVLVQRLNLAGLRLAQQYADQIGRVQGQNESDAWKQRYLDASNQVQTLTRQLAQSSAALAAQGRAQMVQAQAQTQVQQPATGSAVQVVPAPNRMDQTRRETGTTSRKVAEEAKPPASNLATTTHHVGPTSGGGTATPTGSRKHSVKSGETPAIIAKKYGISLKDLMAANPNLDARRLKVGMELNIPGK